MSTGVGGGIEASLRSTICHSVSCGGPSSAGRCRKSSARLRRILRSIASRSTRGCNVAGEVVGLHREGTALLSTVNGMVGRVIVGSVSSSSASPSLTDNNRLIFSPMRRIFLSRASRSIRLVWMLFRLSGLTGGFGVFGEVSSGRGMSWWVRRRGSSSKPSDSKFATESSTAVAVPRWRTIGFGCRTMGGGAESKYQVFPSVFGGDTMGL